MELAYIAQGKLYLARAGGAQAVESAFAREFTQRSLQLARKNEWKNQRRDGMWQNMNLWNVGAGDGAAAIRINFMDATRGLQPGEVLYCMETDRVCGLFRQTLASGEELRLVHHNKFLLRQVRRHPHQARLAGSFDNPNGTASLVLIEGDNYQMREMTEGDSRDQNPTWIPGRDDALVYQSAGVARNQAGHAIGYGPSALMRLDMAAGSLDTLLENPAFDFMQPQFAADGTLFYIRRPYQMHAWKADDMGKWFMDVVLFPFRVVRAVIDYLNYFSMMYSRKPLKTAGGPARSEDDMGAIMLHGRMLAVKKELQQFAADGTPALVPRDWELIRQTRDGVVSVLSKGVVAFDLSPDGEVAYTNGTGIFAMAADGSNRRQLGRAWLVERLCAL